jgi:hypothetical protein
MPYKYPWQRRGLVRWFRTRFRRPRVQYQRVPDIKQAPICHCGTAMIGSGGYLMGGSGDFLSYECPNDRPWNYWRHSDWVVQRPEIRDAL